MLREWISAALDRTGTLTLVASIVLGFVAGALLSKVVTLPAGLWENATGTGMVLGAAVAFVLDLTLVAPFRLWRKERARRELLEATSTHSVPVGGLLITGDNTTVNYRPEPDPATSPATPAGGAVASADPPPPPQWWPATDLSQKLFRGSYVRLADLVVPGEPPVVSGLTFEDCYLVGPMVVNLVGCELTNNVFGIEEDDLESILFEVEPRVVLGPMRLVGCAFHRCTWRGVGFLGDHAFAEMMRTKVALPTARPASSAVPEPAPAKRRKRKR